MTKDQFMLQASRLLENFGSSSIGKERLRMFFREVENLSPEWWTNVVDRWIGELRSAPMLPDVRELANVERERLRQIEKAKESQNPLPASPACSYCQDVGVFNCSRKGHEGLWSFRCHCERGQRDPRKALPFFTDNHSQEYAYVERRISK